MAKKPFRQTKGIKNLSNMDMEVLNSEMRRIKAFLSRRMGRPLKSISITIKSKK